MQRFGATCQASMSTFWTAQPEFAQICFGTFFWTFFFGQNNHNWSSSIPERPLRFYVSGFPLDFMHFHFGNVILTRWFMAIKNTEVLPTFFRGKNWRKREVVFPHCSNGRATNGDHGRIFFRSVTIREKSLVSKTPRYLVKGWRLCFERYKLINQRDLQDLR